MRPKFVTGVCAVFVLIAPIALFAASPSDFLARTYTESGLTLPYRLFKPLNYDPSKEYPLVLFMHGAGERGTNNTSQINGNIDNLLAHVKTTAYSAFLLAPQSDSSWLSYDEPPSNATRMTLSVISQLEHEFSVDKSRLYVTGLSMGGGGTWDMIGRRPGMFAAAVPICGYGDTDRASVMVSQPIWAFHAADDPTVSVAYTREMVNAVRDAGGHPLYTEYATGGHGIWSTVYNTQSMYNWMFSQSIVVPEPASSILAIIGIVGIGCYFAPRRLRNG